MKNIKEFYILGLPIETEFGVCSFLKVKDYPNYYLHLNCISLSKLHIIQTFYDNGIEEGAIVFLQQRSLYEIVTIIQDTKKYYEDFFTYIMGKEFLLDNINEEQFNDLRKLVMEMNCLKEEKINPNPEIQAWIDKSKKFKTKQEGKLEFSDIVSSIVGYNGITYENINNMTLYQLYMTFYRIAQIKNYDTTTLFATVSTEKLNIESWYKNIDLLQEENNGYSREEYNKMKGSVFG